MRTIKIGFVDFWPDFDYKKFFMYNYLSKYYHLIISDEPDYLFCSSFGYKHWKYSNCIKIYYTAENLIPDFNIYDYGIGFYYLSLEDRYLRFPLWLIYSWNELNNMEDKNIDKELCERKFCNFVYSNSGWADPIREKFYKEISKYKRVDSGGAYLNNIGYRVPDKLDFIKNYKFTIAIENSVVPGYTTEKIIEPMIVNSIPIYYGDPYVDKDFNMYSCIHIRNFDSIQSSIDYIIQLDKDDSLYISKLRQKWFAYENIKNVYDRKLRDFFENIFDQEKTDAIRLVDYGFARRYRKELSRTTPWATTFLIEKGYGLLDRLKRIRL